MNTKGTELNREHEGLSVSKQPKISRSSEIFYPCICRGIYVIYMLGQILKASHLGNFVLSNLKMAFLILETYDNLMIKYDETTELVNLEMP